MATILITGGCGFIGSHIAEALVRQDTHRVRVLDNLSSAYHGDLEPVREGVEFIGGDRRDADAVNTAMQNVTCVFHEAALVSVTASVEDPMRNHEINITGTLNVLEAARRAGAKRLVTASSAAVYGHNQNLPLTENAATAPASPYAVAKLTDEYYARLYAELYGLETVVLRYFNVFGPGQDPSSMYSGVISKFADRIRQGQTPCIYGDGKQSRDFVFVKDVVAANLAAMTAGNAGNGDVINIGTGTETTVHELLDLLEELAGVDLPPDYDEPRPGDVRHSLADIARAQQLLDYTPRFTLKQGLHELFH